MPSDSCSAPTISVILPAYDQPGFLTQAIASVAAQTCRDFELLVIDDGSPTELKPTFDAAANGDERIRYIWQSNAGGAAARNRGVTEARGTWIAFLDHDDLWHRDKLAQQLEAAQTWKGETPGLVFCQFAKLNERKTESDSAPFPESSPSGDLLGDLFRSTLIRTLSVVLIHKDAIPQGQDWFRTELAIANDVELYYRIAAAHPIVFVPRVLVRKREHDANASSDHLRLHLETVQIVDEVIARMQADGPSRSGLMRLARKRLQRHLLGAASAARAGKQRRLAMRLYARGMSNRPVSMRALAGWIAALVGA